MTTFTPTDRVLAFLRGLGLLSVFLGVIEIVLGSMFALVVNSSLLLMDIGLFSIIAGAALIVSSYHFASPVLKEWFRELDKQERFRIW